MKPTRPTPDKYWAAEEDNEIFAAYLRQKIDRWFDHKEQTGLASRVRRSWKYYHNLFYGPDKGGEREIRELGERPDRKLSGLSINHFRNILQHLLTIATVNPPTYEILAVSASPEALRQARLADALLHRYQRTHNVLQHSRKAVENALICGAGYLLTVWDPQRGRSWETDNRNKIYEGDLYWSAPAWWDVVTDHAAGQWEDNLWVAVRSKKNRWRLIEQYPEHADYIREWSPPNADANEIVNPALEEDHPDFVSIWEFWHLPMEELPDGRYAVILGERTLYSGPMPYDDLPVDRVTAGNYLGLNEGYSPSFDLQGPFEALNGEISAILNNHKNLAGNLLWAPTTTNVGVSQISERLTLIQSDQKPELMNFSITPPESFRFVDLLLAHMELVSGINSAVRGEPQASLRSGRALALIAAQSTQFAAPLLQAYSELLATNATRTLRIIRRFVKTPRLIGMVGRQRTIQVGEFIGDDLELVDRVLVQPGNALTRTIAGRMEIADRLLERGFLRNREEYITVATTGQLDPMLEGDESQVFLVREENEALLQGQPHTALATDNHVLHIREHQALLSSLAVRNDPAVVPQILAAVMEHMRLLDSPEVQRLQMQLGFQVPTPPVAPIASTPAPAPTEGALPEEPALPSQEAQAVTAPVGYGAGEELLGG